MKIALTQANIKKFDKSDMLGLLLDLPLQLEAGIDIASKAKVIFEERDFTKIVFAGVGGSGIGAELVKSYLYLESKIPIFLCQEYELPAYIDSSTLVFILSYSGDTEETLSAYSQAKRQGAYVIAISSGGKLTEYASRDKTTLIAIPGGLPPRSALGYMSAIPLCLLERLGVTKDIQAQINQAIRVLKELRDNNLRPNIGLKDNIAKAIAVKLFDKLVFVYSASVHFGSCAVRLRSQLAENAKALASVNFFPEMNHNEIVGWQNPGKSFKNFVVLVLRDKAMHKRTSVRMDITKDILQGEGVEVIEVWSRGEGLLSRIFSLVYIGDFISYYLAILYGIDPTPVDKITYLKNRLALIP